MSPVPNEQYPDQEVVLSRCPLCDERSHAVIAAYPELTWVRCTCGLIYKRSEKRGTTSEDFYEGGYFGQDDDGRAYNTRTKRRIQKSRNQISDLLNHVEPGPLLDIGCSLGYTLQAAKQLGLTATGADISEHAVKTCREAGFAAEQAELDALPFEDGAFKLVVMKHVLEHTPAPRAALKEVRRVLNDGGGVFIAIPHAGYHKAVRDPRRYRFYLPEKHGAEHFIYYTPQTLSQLLMQEGFTPVKVHPHLLHKTASPAKKVTQAAVAPLRAAGQAALNKLSLRKEFWLVATRNPDS